MPSQTHAAFHALLSSAAFAPLPDLAWIRVVGLDRVRWLNGMVTNSIQALQPGQGAYCFVLNAQGKIQGDLTAFDAEDGNSLLLQTSRAQLPGLMAYLDRYIIMDDVELEDLSPELSGLLVAGPDAAEAVQALMPQPAALPAAPLHLGFHENLGFGALTIVHAYSPLVPRFEIWSDPETIASLQRGMPLPQLSPEHLEALRLLEGTPAYGLEIRDSSLPQETAPTGTESRALYFSKGCYLGQEIVERIHSRGNLHRTFSAFTLSPDQPLPLPGSALTLEAQQPGAPVKAVGELTSVAEIPLPSGPVRLALGTVRRDALLPPRPLFTPSGSQASPVATPFAAAAKISAPAS